MKGGDSHDSQQAPLAEALLMSRAEEIYAVEATILKWTAKALLIEVDGERLWLPRSQLIDEEELPIDSSKTARVKMTAWIAKTKGLI